MVNKARKVEEVDQFISNLPKDIQNITVALRKIIFESSPELTEEFKWSMPNYSYNGLVCYLQTSKKHVNLGFHKGNELQEKDINKLLQGTGKTMRHIRIKKTEEIHPEAFTSLIKEAMALNKG
ncbi:DUF1801 domain-containing protein [Lentibacillus amyloliquefaciens]|uniref:YdhG-like domain-containing protein n=1 Tax=Lentibacillus amyloliquefaciens TaxID=1472767 RepID=A0A0U4FI69_9BACI|nr:DUF1801 domain-containing protein [Lentibacillus amyloliquefaciens]ALX48302.1 hypothetical protein AOX59_06580 [Lentibacillus amyloliquefaciens]